MILIDDSLGDYSREKYEALLSDTPEWRLKTLERLARFDDRLRSLLAFRLLREGLKVEFGMDYVPPFSFHPGGKPYFAGLPDIHFNLSHCSAAVACAVSRSPVGIDVESILPFDSEVAEYVLSPLEFESLRKSDYRDVDFAVLWTRKESVCKLSGEGLPSQQKLRDILKEPGTLLSTTVNMRKGYVVSVAMNRGNNLADFIF